MRIGDIEKEQIECLLTEEISFSRFDPELMRRLDKTVQCTINGITPTTSFTLWGFARSDKMTGNCIVAFVKGIDLKGAEISLDLPIGKGGRHYFYPIQRSRGTGRFKVTINADRSIYGLSIEVAPWSTAREDRFLSSRIGCTPLITQAHRGLLPPPEAIEDLTEYDNIDLEFGLTAGAQRDLLVRSIKLLTKSIRLTDSAEIRTRNLVDALKELTSSAAQLSLRTRDRPLSREIVRTYVRLGDLQRATELNDALAGDNRHVSRLVSLQKINATPVVRRPTPFVASSGVVPYLLHNCMPYHHGGYATRAQGLISGWTNAGERIVPVARLGYPGDRLDIERPVSSSVDVGGTIYRYLPMTGASVDDPDQREYAQSYAHEVIKMLEGTPVKLVLAASFFSNAFAARLVADYFKVPMAYDMRGMTWITNRAANAAASGSEIDRIQLEAELQAARSADFIFCITEQLRDWLVTNGIHAERTWPLPNGVDPGRFQLSQVSDDAKAKVGYLSDEFILGYIGTVVHYEGFRTLFRALSALPNNVAGKTKMLVVGDGPFLEEARSIASEAGLNHVVKFAGRVPHSEVQTYYAAIDAIVMPREANELSNMISPIKPFESLALGKVTIASNCAAIASIYRQANCGRIFEAGNALSLSEAILDVKENYGHYSRDALRGHKWVGRHRDWNVIAGNAAGFWNSNRLVGK